LLSTLTKLSVLCRKTLVDEGKNLIEFVMDKGPASELKEILFCDQGLIYSKPKEEIFIQEDKKESPKVGDYEKLQDKDKYIEQLEEKVRVLQEQLRNQNLIFQTADQMMNLDVTETQ